MSNELAKVEETAVIERTPELIAVEIRSIDSQTREIVLRSAIEIGKRLKEAKGLVAHGEWGKWLGANVSYGQSTAINFMRVSDEYANSHALANLNYSQAIALLALPADEREAFAEENDVESMSTRELQVAIKASQELERQLKESQEKERLALEAHDREVQKRKELEEKGKNQQQLIEQLEKAQSDGDDESVAQLAEELEESKLKVKELEEELHKKPIDIPAKEIVEVVPEETKQELEALRQRESEMAAKVKQREEESAKQLAELQEQLRKNNNTAAIKVKVCFETLVGNFKELMTAVGELENEEQRKAIKERIAGLIEQARDVV